MIYRSSLFFTRNISAVFGTLHDVKKIVVSTGIEVEDFVEASVQLLQPLENFFNNVFVMVVCSYNPFTAEWEN